MIELRDDRLVIDFPEVHPEAKCTIEFQRTLRIPDDGREYPLPAGLGAFPLRHVDDHARHVPEPWLEHGGVMLPMYQAEALWVNFRQGYGSYPFAIKIAAGKINALTGEQWREGLNRDPQDYAVVPGQPWIDGYCVERGVVRQFVAMPLGHGYSAEEQITGRGEVGGLQIVAYPMKRGAYERLYAVRSRARGYTDYMALTMAGTPGLDMGLAPGGRMRQEIYKDRYSLADWDQRQRVRCFVHIANSVMWRAITGETPPTRPITAKQYAQHGIPWFDYYDCDNAALEGSGILQRLKSVVQKSQERREALPENDSIVVDKVVRLRSKLRKSEVRQGVF